MAALMSTFFVTRHARADEERGRAELIRRPGAPHDATGRNAHRRRARERPARRARRARLVGGAGVGGSAPGSPPPRRARVHRHRRARLPARPDLARRERYRRGRRCRRSSRWRRGRRAWHADRRALAASAWPSWLSPIGWGQHVFAFTRQDAHLSPPSRARRVTAAAALAIQAGRISARACCPNARARDRRARLRSTFGLAWRQQWPSVIGWSVGAAFRCARPPACSRPASPPRRAGSRRSTPAVAPRASCAGGKGELIVHLLVRRACSASRASSPPRQGRRRSCGRAGRGGGWARGARARRTRSPHDLAARVHARSARSRSLVVLVATGLTTADRVPRARRHRSTRGSRSGRRWSQAPAALTFVGGRRAARRPACRAPRSRWAGASSALGIGIGLFGGSARICPTRCIDAQPDQQRARPFPTDDWVPTIVRRARSPSGSRPWPRSPSVGETW